MLRLRSRGSGDFQSPSAEARRNGVAITNHHYRLRVGITFYAISSASGWMSTNGETTSARNAESISAQ